MGSPDFGYAHARLQARHALRPTPAQWQLLQACRTAAHGLAVAHDGPWAHWVQGLDRVDDTHHLERSLRARWQAHVHEVAAWVPARWRDAVRGFAALPDLGLQPAPQAALRWWTAWQRQLPGPRPAAELARQPAQALLPRLHDPRGRRSAEDPTVQARLTRLLRRHGATPVSVFAHLALSALEVERLRGVLVARHCLPSAPSESGVEAP